MLKKKRSKFFIILKMTLLCCLHSISQDSVNTINKINISSPTAASLGKYGDIPVNYNTGVPNIDVPIYTIETKDLTVPISLSYHASGLKVQELASWVGAGFALNCTGVITRSVVGLPDDKGSGPTMFTHGHYSDYGFNNYLYEPSGGQTGITFDGYRSLDFRFWMGYRDGEPDMFTFNFGGISGKFYYNDDRTPIIVPEQDIRIETDYVTGSGFLGFVATTSAGIKYYFGRTGNNGSVNPIETTIPQTFQEGPLLTQKAASSWYLNKIISADGTDSVLFNYQAENYGYYTVSMFPISSYTSPSFGVPSQYGHNLVKNLVQGVRLTNISFPNGAVTFLPSATPRTDLVQGYPTIINDGQANTTSYSLGEIQVSNGSNFCKKFLFNYSYFYDNVNQLRGPVLSSSSFSNITSDRYKLRLDSLKELSCDATVKKPPYIFNYYSEIVPRALSLGLDHWGYYNGITNNNGLIPEHKVKYQHVVTLKAGANREAAWPAMRGGALQKITYPTGGFSSFDYEANNVRVNYNTYNIVQPYSMGVGYDGNSNPLEQNYTFSGNEYQLILSNTLCNVIGCSNTFSTALFNIYNLSNGLVFGSGAINGGETKSFTLILPAGTYKISLKRNNASGSSGASLQFKEFVPVWVSEDKIVGGLRIKTVTNNDGVTATNMITNYSYSTGSQSSGILYSRPDYVKLIKNKMQNLVWPVSSGPNCTILGAAASPGLASAIEDQYYKSPVSVRPMQTVQGNHIGYNEVKVAQTGNGHSIYRYYGSNYWDNQISDVCSRFVNWDNPCDISVPETPSAPVEFEFKRSELKYEGHYNQSGNIIKDKWSFPQYQDNVISTPGHISTEANGWGIHTDYHLRSVKKIMDSTVETTYTPGFSGLSVATTNVLYYNSRYHVQPTQKISYGSASSRLVTKYSYAFDFLPSTCISVNDGLSTYLSGIAADSVVFFNTLDTCVPQSPPNLYNSCRYQTSIDFRRKINLKRVAYINTRKSSFTNPINAYKTAHDNAKSAALADYKPILEMQDLHINALIEQTTLRDNLLINSAYTRYDYSTNPASRVYPVLFQVINISTPTAGFNGLTVNGANTNLVKDSRYKDEKTFKFYLGHLVEITEKDGITTSYVYGHNNTLPVVKAEGVNHATLLGAYNAVAGNLNTIRGQASLSNAFVSTYTYTPLVGMTSEADENDQKQFYEYDVLGRLKIVRDHENNVLRVIDYKYQTLN